MSCTVNPPGILHQVTFVPCGVKLEHHCCYMSKVVGWMRGYRFCEADFSVPCEQVSDAGSKPQTYIKMRLSNG